MSKKQLSKKKHKYFTKAIFVVIAVINLCIAIFSAIAAIKSSDIADKLYRSENEEKIAFHLQKLEDNNFIGGRGIIPGTGLLFTRWKFIIINNGKIPIIIKELKTSISSPISGYSLVQDFMIDLQRIGLKGIIIIIKPFSYQELELNLKIEISSNFYSNCSAKGLTYKFLSDLEIFQLLYENELDMFGNPLFSSNINSLKTKNNMQKIETNQPVITITMHTMLSQFSTNFEWYSVFH